MSRFPSYSVLVCKDPIKFCYQCDSPVYWLAPDGRCSSCTRCTPEEITGGAL